MMKRIWGSMVARAEAWFYARCQAFLHKRGFSVVKLIERAVYLVDRQGTYHKVQGLKP